MWSYAESIFLSYTIDYVFIRWDSVDATPQLDTRQKEDKTYVKQPLIDRNRGVANRHGIPFEFTIKLPKPRKARKITKRDELGRIIWTKAK